MEIQRHEDLHDPPDNEIHTNQSKTSETKSTSTSESDKDHIDNDDATIAASNAPPQLTYHRSDMKITIKGSTQDHYLDSLKQIQLYFKQLQKYDDHAVIAPWKETSNSPTITNPDDIPSDEDDAEDYFDGLNPKDKPGFQQIWFKI